MEWDFDNSVWCFFHHQCNGAELFGIVYHFFCQYFQTYINDGTLIPGWHWGQNFQLAGISRHVSASTLQRLIRIVLSKS